MRFGVNFILLGFTITWFGLSKRSGSALFVTILLGVIFISIGALYTWVEWQATKSNKENKS